MDRLKINDLIFREESFAPFEQSGEYLTKVFQASADGESEESNEKRLYAFLRLVLNKVYAEEDSCLLFDHILKATHESKQGSLNRHLTVFMLLCAVDYNDNSGIFSRVISEIRFLVEFLFNEIFPVLQSQDTKYSPEEIMLLSEKFIDFMKIGLFGVLTRNAANNQHLNPKMKILRHTDFFEFDFISGKTVYHSKVGRNVLNANSLLVFIGNLIAKLDMAIFFAQQDAANSPKTQADSKLSSTKLLINKLKELHRELEKNYKHLFVNAMEIIRAQSDFIDYLKYRRTFWLIDQASYKTLRTSSLFEVSSELESDWKGYTSFLCLWLWKTRVMGESSYFHLMKPWFVVKSILNQVCYLELDFYRSGPFFSKLFEWLNSYIEKLGLRSLDNINSGNLDLAGQLYHLRNLTWQTQESFTKTVASIFEKLFQKIPDINSRYRILNDCLESTTEIQFHEFISIASLILRLYSEEVKKELA